ncbi:hypothetical protein FDP41_003136 [Naegleria fowleri]|uniref:Uncharacterized protein n=1 Tax=Naegleria fowleri TaxID=5763 RepID=A0A6A5BU86_NAEFO|nr:uncharacterized protein FDP41_003136 [Naegleria fowleri]KAF0977814.1 hypothetical protein FDP41_003136 [Naegleria fowleri]CAG4712430.1 unnamed protein product [Naegleria fowleri]
MNRVSSAARRNSTTNLESAEKEYLKEQALMEAKRLKHLKLEEQRRIVLAGSREEKKQLQQIRKQEIDNHIEIRKRNEAFQDCSAKLSESSRAASTNTALESKNPISAQYNRIMTNQTARKEFEKSIMMENMKMQQLKQQMKRKEGEEERKQAARGLEYFHNRPRSFL